MGVLGFYYGAEITITILLKPVSEHALIKISDIAATIRFSLLSFDISVSLVYVIKSKCFKKKAYTEASSPQGPPSF